jgi:hypothetical protein
MVVGRKGRGEERRGSEGGEEREKMRGGERACGKERGGVCGRGREEGRREREREKRGELISYLGHCSITRNPER